MLLDLTLQATEEDAGSSLLRQLRADPVLGRTPVLIFSADIQTLRDRADDLRKHRLVSFLEKPFSVAQLEEAVRLMVAANGRLLAPRHR